MADPITLRTASGDEHLDLVDFEARVRRGEVAPEALVRVPAITGERFLPAAQLTLFTGLHEPRRAHFSRAFTLFRFPPLTTALVFFMVSVFLATAENGQLELDAMVRYGGKVGPLVTDLGELWRLLTANFLHRDALHLGVNLVVLFHVGGALENTYRTLDYLWLLVFTGIATMATSLLLNDAITIGASGMVFGCLGGLVAFGLKYRSALPSRYRSLLADATIPAVIGLFFIGVTSRGVDTWAHLGGLVAGLVTGTFMRPRLLVEARRRWEPALRAAPSLGVLAVVGLGQWLFFGNGLPVMRLERDDGYGLSMPVPRGWLKGANPLGALAWYNGLAGLGRASFAAEAVEMPEGADAAEQAARFVAERLRPERLGSEVRAVHTSPLEPTRVGERDAWRLRGAIEGALGTTRLLAWFVPQGTTVFQLVFLWPEDSPRYAVVGEQMVAGLKLEEPRALRQARLEALVFPNSPPVLARLGGALLEHGDAAPASEALQAAVRAAPSIVEWRAELSRALLVAGDVERACLTAQDALRYEPDEPLALEAEARCELARGNPSQALEQLKRASAALPADERLKSAVDKLGASLEAR